jgi:hypothetical protein
MQHLKAKNSKT